MKAPIDKLVSGGNNIFQVITTHRCSLRCANCTQGQGYRQYDMTPEVFRDCCRALSDWPGVVGMFGRLPLLHPKIRELLTIMREELPNPRNRGLWANDIPDMSLIPELQDTFTPDSTFNLNAHGEPEAYERLDECFPGRVIPESKDRYAMHSPVRVAIQDFIGTPQVPTEESMWEQIAGCHINRDWSGAVYQRIRDGKPTAVASFCEVSAAFDITYDTDSGVAVEPGFWRWGMDRYDHQYKKWCRQCGVPLQLRGNKDVEGVEVYSKTHEPLIQLKNSVRKTAIRLDVLPSGRVQQVTDYERRNSAEEVTV